MITRTGPCGASRVSSSRSDRSCEVPHRGTRGHCRCRAGPYIYAGRLPITTSVRRMRHPLGAHVAAVRCGRSRLGDRPSSSADLGDLHRKSLAVVRSRCQEETGPGAPECARRRSGQHCPAGSGGSRWSGRQPDKPAGQRQVDGRAGSGFTRDWTAYELPLERDQLTARLGRRTGGRAWTVRRAAGGPPVLRCPAPADHRDPVTTNHLPGGKAESAAKTGTAR
jgi:hypothetical protein